VCLGVSSYLLLFFSSAGRKPRVLICTDEIKIFCSTGLEKNYYIYINGRPIDDVQPQLVLDNLNLGARYESDLDRLIDVAKKSQSRKPSKALEAYYTVFCSRRKGLGPRHDKTLEAALDIARLLEAQEWYKTAVKWYSEIFAVQGNTLGKEDVTTLRTAYNVAKNLAKLGNYKAALKWYEEVFVIRKEIRGSTDPETLEAADGVAEMLETQGKIQTALTWYSQITQAREQTLGKDHHETLKSIRSEDLVRRKLGRSE
jgi:tetratricopeptide (TPR) repeat protein